MKNVKDSLATEPWYTPLNFLVLVGCIIVSHLAGAIGLLVSPGPGPVYQALEKPPGLPPGPVFGIVWPVLYSLIGIALFTFMRRAEGSDFRNGLKWFAIQWTFNALWTPLFFGFGLRTLALADLVMLLGALAVLIRLFARVSFAAAALLLPYSVWCLFAIYLNAGIVVLNQ